jgi:NADH-quinone oxidoreductase subunit H
MLTLLLIDVLKIGLVLFALLSAAGLMTWVERKQSAAMQDRIGPNRADIYGFTVLGLFHPIADGLKMFTKEDFRPKNADPYLFPLAPVLAFAPAVIAFAVVPFGGTLYFGEGAERWSVPLQIADLNVGILFVFAILSLAVYGVVLAGWASANNWSLLGGLRAASQMISYEVAMGLSAMGIFMVYGSLSLGHIAAEQGRLLFGFLPAWGIFLQPLGFVLFLVAVIAETKRAPFDNPEGESEIVAGYFVEYSGMKFGLFFLGEFIEIVVAGALVTTLFLGSYHIPFVLSDPALGFGLKLPGMALWEMSPNLIALMQAGAFVFKTCVMVFLLQTIRWTLPRFRYDQVMNLGWKMLFPLALANLVLTALVAILLG